MKTMHIDSISCGQGSPSLYLIVLAGRGLFPCDVVIVADTGSENDMLWSDGRRTDAETFFNEVTRPLAEYYGIDAAFVRAVNKNKEPMAPLYLNQRYDDKVRIDMPLYGSNGGRLKQACTDKYKKRAIKQELRRRGAVTATCSLGLTMDEVHRMNQSTEKWEVLQWPLITTIRDGGKRGWRREEIQTALSELKIPYIVRSQCDYCPHKNLFRWKMSTKKTIEAAARWEKTIGKDEYYLTPMRIPLKKALEVMKSRQPERTLFDSCDSGYCFT